MLGHVTVRSAGKLTIAVMLVAAVAGQDAFAADLRGAYREPPVNEHLADSPWPTYHRNPFAQASTPLRGPEAGDDLEVKILKAVRKDPGDQPLPQVTSPWLPLSERYPGGCRAAFGSGIGTVTKTLTCGDDFELVDQVSMFEITGDPLDVYAPPTDGNRWSNLLLRGNRLIVPDNRHGKIYKFGDVDPKDPRSKIELKQTFTVPEDKTPGDPSVPQLTYDGKLLYVTSEGWVGVVDADTFAFERAVKLAVGGDAIPHNNFPIDEDGGMYIATSTGMNKLRWTGSDIEVQWGVPYDSRGLGINAPLGTGTTPTLLGMDGDPDKLVAIVDAKSPSNMVAFWREEIPADWKGLPGLDRRVAAVFPLSLIDPLSTGWAVENSPPARGYDIAVQQSNGLRHEATLCRPDNGIHKLSWDPAANRFREAWATDDVNVNSVMTYSEGSNLLYGIGQEGCDVVLYGLDWDSGKVKLRRPLGGSEFFDGGDNLVIDDDRSLLYSPVGNSIVRIRPRNDNAPGPDRRWRTPPPERPRRACASRRAFDITLRAPRGTRIGSVRVTLGGRPVTVRGRGALRRATIDLRGRARGRATVRIRIRTTHGRLITDTREYRTCTSR